MMKKHVLVCLCLLCCVCSGAYGKAEAKHRNLLFINSSCEGDKYSESLLLPVIEEVGKYPEVDLYVEHLNARFITNDSLFACMADHLFTRYGSLRPDYIVMYGGLAFSLRDEVYERWGEIPILFINQEDSVHNREHYYSAIPMKELPPGYSVPLSGLRDKYNFTAMVLPPYCRETVDMMVSMKPDMRTFIFASDSSYLNRYHERELRAYLEEKYPHIRYQRISSNGVMEQEFRKYIMDTSPERGLLMGTWHHLREDLLGTKVIMSNDNYAFMKAANNRCFTLSYSIMEAGDALACYTSDREEAYGYIRRTLQKAFSGVRMGDIPFYYPTTHYPLVNYAKLKPEYATHLLPGTRFVNKPLPFYRQYKTEVISGVILILSLCVLLSMRYRSQQRRISLLKQYRQLINDMPIVYAEGRILHGEGNRPVDIGFLKGNVSFRNKFREAGDTECYRKGRFPSRLEKYLLRFIPVIEEKGLPISFTYYMDEMDMTYEVFLTPVSGNRVNIFGIDTSELHLKEREMRRLNNKLAMALELSGVISWELDLKERNILYDRKILQSGVMPALQETDKKGSMPLSEYMGYIHPDDLDRITASLDELLAERIGILREEHRLVSHRKNGRHVDWVEINARLERGSENSHKDVLIGSALLTTERRNREMELIRSREKAQQSDRLKSAFLANMSHEIRTPLNAIVGFSSLLANTDEKKERQEYIRIIENNNELLLQLISDILDLSKIEAGTLEFVDSEVDLNDLMLDLKSSAAMRVPEGVDLELVLGLPECRIITERNRLVQVLGNLLTNACKFTKSGEIRFGYELENGNLLFFVKDTGCGIPAEQQQNIFNRFIKLDNFTKGTGLGLPICQSIVEKMEGEISVESEPGKGSTFRVRIPYRPVRHKSEKSDRSAEKLVIAARDSISILIAEDEESNYKLLSSILKKKYNLLHAWDGKEAVELYRQHRPDMILMDINMPVMDGYEATREIRKISVTVPIIAVTAYAYESDRQRILNEGFDSYMAKPIRSHKLEEAIVELLNKRFLFL